MSQLKVHRISALPVRAAPLAALAVSPDGHRLAALRDDGALELWRRAARWYRELRTCALDGRDGERGASAVCWLGDGAVLCGALGGPLREVCARSGSTTARHSVAGGAVWALAARPGAGALCVAAAGEDGCVRLLERAADGALVLRRTLAPQKARVVSLAWHCRGEILVSGDAAGGVCVWAPARATAPKQRFEVPRKTGAGREAAVVWSVAVLPDTTVVTGDSNGAVGFWSARLGTPLHRAVEHAADVLAVTASADGRFVFAAGVDAKIVVFQSTNVGQGGGGGGGKVGALSTPWIVALAERAHTHDVRALVTAPYSDVDGTEALLAGSLDCSISVSALSKLPKSIRLLRLPLARWARSVSLARDARALVAHSGNGVSLWRLGDVADDAEASGRLYSGARLPLRRGLRCIASLNLRADTLVLASAVTADLSTVAVATRDATKLFSVTPGGGGAPSRDAADADADAVRIRRVRGAPLPPAVALAFAGRDAVVLASRDGDVLLCDAAGAAPPVVLDAAPRTVLALAVSADNRWAAVAFQDAPVRLVALDSAAAGDTYDLPQLSAQALDVAFLPHFDALVVTCADASFHVWDMSARALHAWSRAHHANLPRSLLSRREGVRAPVLNPARPDSLLFWSDLWLMPVDLTRAPATGGKMAAPKLDHFWFHKRYTNLLLVDFVDDDEMVAVELPAKELIEQLPKTLFRSKFGL